MKQQTRFCEAVATAIAIKLEIYSPRHFQNAFACLSIANSSKRAIQALAQNEQTLVQPWQILVSMHLNHYCHRFWSMVSQIE